MRIIKMLQNRVLCPLMFSLCISSICLGQNGDSTSRKSELIFQSGFEKGTSITTDSGTNDHGAALQHISGNDKSFSEKSNWDTNWYSLLRNGKMEVQYTGGAFEQRHASIIAEPGNPSNHVLCYWLNDSWPADLGQQKARIQTNLYGMREGMKEFYQSVRVFLSEDFNTMKTFPGKVSWCTLAEFWNNEWWSPAEKYGFRVTLGIGKPNKDPNELNFILNAENADQKEVWNADNTLIKVPIGKWFTMDYYFKEGDQHTGRFYMAITPEGDKKQIVFDVTNFTHNTFDPSPDGLTDFNPMKLYTSSELISYIRSKGKTLQIYWDDYRFWKNKRP